MHQVFMVHHGDVDQTLRNLKKSLQREGISPNKKIVFEKKSDKLRHSMAEAKRRISRQDSHS